MTGDLDIAAYVVNLDRSPDRLRSAATQLDKTGLKWKRISAVDGQKFGDAIVAPYDARAFARNVGRAVTAGEIALYLSHINAMQTFLEGPTRFGLIFEDDLKIDDIAAFKRVVATLTDRCDLWDIVKLSSVHRYPVPISVARLYGPYMLAAPLLKTTGAACYMINRHAAEIIPKALRPFDDPFDHRLDQPWHFGLRYRVVFPFPVREAAFNTTIDYSRREARFSPWQRRYALYYRLRVGLLRFAYNARHGFFVPMFVKSLFTRSPSS